MKKAELRKVLHAMIDNLADKHVLYNLKENIFPYVIEYRTKQMDKADDGLTEEQILQLDETIRQADTGETVSRKDVKKSFAKWLPDEQRQKKKDDKKIAKTSKKKLREKLHILIDDIKSKYMLNVLLDDIMPDALNSIQYE
ncbi:MAG: hypothetical protein ABI472_13665 [Ginsengibacter sp.]